MNCPTCTRPASQPFYRCDNSGNVVVGCIDQCHGTHLFTNAYASWWNRKESKAIRVKLANGRKGKGY